MTQPVSTLVFASNNAHKLKEIRQLLGDSYQVLSLADIGCHADIPETADTLEGNAEQKARYVAERYGYDCFADDTGLFVDALGGEPGVYSARYAGEGCTPADNVAKLLAAMQGIDQRQAHFSTVIAFIRSGEVMTFEGRVDGVITRQPSGTDGFGYDPVFEPDGVGMTFAEMPAADKNSISHRGRAVARFVDHLKSLL